MVKVTLYGGVGEIGGNKVLVEDSGTRIMLDFGRRMGEAGKYYEEYIQVRSKCALLDLIKLGILPKIDGIYPQHLLDCTSLKNENVDIEAKLPMDKADDYWRLTSLHPFTKEKPGIDALFISHAHFDHIQDVSFIHKDLPIYCTKITKILSKSITDVSKGGAEYQFYSVDDYDKISIISKNPHSRTVFPGELEYKIEDEVKPIKDLKTGYVLTRETHRNIRKFITENTGKVGSIKYKIIPVGHSVPGASSILLTTSKGKQILYTGDIRFDNSSDISLADFLKEIGTDGIDVLICEGTRIHNEKKLTEEHVYKDIIEQVKKINGLLLIDFGWKDITRFDTIAKVAQEVGRTLVINPKLAYLLYELHVMDNEKYSDPTKLEHIKVYKKRQKNYLYAKQDYEKFKAGYLEHWGKNNAKADQNIVRISEKLGIGGDLTKEPQKLTEEEKKAWKLAIHHIEKGIPAYKIRTNPDQFILMFSFWDVNELFDLSDSSGELSNSKYIRASCEPFNDEMEIDERKFMNWLDKFGIDYETKEDVNYFKRAHVSGHASRPELRELIEKINPKCLIPIHTEHPKAFNNIIEELNNDTKVLIPEVGKPYQF